MKYSLNETLSDINVEVYRARAKFPGNRFMLAALTEEVGELAQALLQKKARVEIQKEAIQVAAVAIRIIEEGDASFANISDFEAWGADLTDEDRLRMTEGSGAALARSMAGVKTSISPAIHVDALPTSGKETP